MTIAKYDWAAIKAEYISSSISLRDLAAKYGIPWSTLRDRAGKERWAEEREKARNKLVTRTVQKTVNRASTRIAKNLDKELAIADRLSDLLTRALEDDQQFNRHIITQKMRLDKIEIQTATEKQFDKFDMASFNQATKSLQAIEDVKRRIHGILTEPEKRRDKLDRERLDLDKKRAKLDSDDEEDEHGVIEVTAVMENPGPPTTEEGKADG